MRDSSSDSKASRSRAASSKDSDTRIVERNYRIRSGEIDIVANDAGTVVFVEVKTKTSGDFGDPVEEVTTQKQRQIVSMGEYYATYCCPPDTPCRFDVVTVDFSDAAPAHHRLQGRVQTRMVIHG